MWRTSKNVQDAMARAIARAEAKLAALCAVELTTPSMGDTTVKEKVSAQSAKAKAQ